MDDPGRPNMDTIPSIALEDIDPDKCYFNPGCAMSLYKPEAVEEILHLLNRRFLPTKLHTTCCRHEPNLPKGSTVINNCSGCDRRFRSLYEGVQTVSLWEVLDAIPALPLPTYSVSQNKAHGEGGGKYRTHFHRFMRGVHERLRLHAGESDPLAKIVREARGKLRVLVLDEFFVTDIGDAMLLGRLLERLFAEGITLVTTSNTAPQNLYKDGLQRESFLPAIAQLRQHCVELAADGRQDYRLRALTRSPVYRQPLDADSDGWLGERWQALASGIEARRGSIQIEGRRIGVRGRGHGVAWFDFSELCEGPRSTDDYIEIAREFGIVLLGGVPAFDAGNEDAARRFVNLVDEFYDRQVTLVCTAAAPAVALYHGTRLAGAFERTASRLIEMQSAEYLARTHRG